MARIRRAGCRRRNFCRSPSGAPVRAGRSAGLLPLLLPDASAAEAQARMEPDGCRPDSVWPLAIRVEMAPLRTRSLAAAAVHGVAPIYLHRQPQISMWTSRSGAPTRWAGRLQAKGLLHVGAPIDRRSRQSGSALLAVLVALGGDWRPSAFRLPARCAGKRSGPRLRSIACAGLLPGRGRDGARARWNCSGRR